DARAAARGVGRLGMELDRGVGGRVEEVAADDHPVAQPVPGLDALDANGPARGAVPAGQLEHALELAEAPADAREPHVPNREGERGARSVELPAAVGNGAHRGATTSDWNPRPTGPSRSWSTLSDRPVPPWWSSVRASIPIHSPRGGRCRWMWRSALMNRKRSN